MVMPCPVDPVTGKTSFPYFTDDFISVSHGVRTGMLHNINSGDQHVILPEAGQQIFGQENTFIGAYHHGQQMRNTTLWYFVGERFSVHGNRCCRPDVIHGGMKDVSAYAA